MVREVNKTENDLIVRFISPPVLSLREACVGGDWRSHLPPLRGQEKGIKGLETQETLHRKRPLPINVSVLFLREPGKLNSKSIPSGRSLGWLSPCLCLLHRPWRLRGLPGVSCEEHQEIPGGLGPKSLREAAIWRLQDLKIFSGPFVASLISSIKSSFILVLDHHKGEGKS